MIIKYGRKILEILGKKKGGDGGPSHLGARADIETNATITETYPHRYTWFHTFMGLFTAFCILPLSLLLFPLFVILKLIMVTLCLYAPTAMRISPHGVLGRIVTWVRNLVHHTVYSVFYVHIGIWMNGIGLFKMDDYWYGMDLGRYGTYHRFMERFRNSKIRWKFRKNLKIYHGHGITKRMISDHLCYYQTLFSHQVFRLVFQANSRKNAKFSFAAVALFCLRDVYLLLFLPVRLYLYEKDGRIVGLGSYLKKGNTLIMCHNIIASQYIDACIFFEQMNDLLRFGFNDPDIRYLSCAATTRKAKQACGAYPINFMMTDEFRFLPFSPPISD